MSGPSGRKPKKSQSESAEVTRLAYEALPGQKKMAINMGSAYGEYQRIYNWLLQMTLEGIMDEYTALQLQVMNHVHSERLGSMHLELVTRDDTARYQSLSRIKGVRKEPGQFPQPIPKEKGDEFFAFEHSAFTSISDLNTQYGSIFNVVSQRRDMVRVEVEDGGTRSLPAWVPALRNYVIDAIDALQKMHTHEWYTNKKKVIDERRSLRRRMIRKTFEDFEENIDATLNEELQEEYDSLPEDMRREVMQNVRRRFERERKRFRCTKAEKSEKIEKRRRAGRGRRRRGDRRRRR